MSLLVGFRWVGILRALSRRPWLGRDRQRADSRRSLAIMNSVCVGSPGGRTEGRNSDKGLFLSAAFVIPNLAPSAPASPLSGRTVQSRRKRGVIEVVGDVLFGWVEMPRAHACEPVPDPKIEDGRDAIIKAMACAICGSDLHIFGGMILSYFLGNGRFWREADILRTLD
jgi:hypothetical protein